MFASRIKSVVFGGTATPRLCDKNNVATMATGIIEQSEYIDIFGERKLQLWQDS